MNGQFENIEIKHNCLSQNLWTYIINHIVCVLICVSFIDMPLWPWIILCCVCLCINRAAHQCCRVFQYIKFLTCEKHPCGHGVFSTYYPHALHWCQEWDGLRDENAAESELDLQLEGVKQQLNSIEDAHALDIKHAGEKLRATDDALGALGSDFQKLSDTHKAWCRSTEEGLLELKGKTCQCLEQVWDIVQFKTKILRHGG